MRLSTEIIGQIHTGLISGAKTAKELAEEFDVSVTTVYRIKNLDKNPRYKEEVEKFMIDKDHVERAQESVQELEDIKKEINEEEETPKTTVYFLISAKKSFVELDEEEILDIIRDFERNGLGKSFHIKYKEGGSKLKITFKSKLDKTLSALNDAIGWIQAILNDYFETSFIDNIDKEDFKKLKKEYISYKNI